MTKYLLRTKSILSPSGKSDGIRVCVMRRIKPEYIFDIWMPILGPSNMLLKKYVTDKNISWAEFSGAYLVQQTRKKLFHKLILELLSMSTVTLLCIEKKASRCHRFILAKECKKLDSRIQIKHI